MDIRGAATYGIQQHLVDEADDRGVFDIVAPDLPAGLIIAAGDFERFEIDAFLVAEARHRGVDLLDGLVEQLLQLVVLDDDGLDAQAALELDLIDGVQIGRIRDAEEQPLAALEQRQHAMLGQQLVGDRAHGLEVDRQRIEIEQRDAVFGGGRDRDVARLGGAADHQLRDEAGFALRGRLQRSMHARLIDHAILHQPLGQAAQGWLWTD